MSVIGARVLRFASVGSTMDEVARLAAAGEPEGTVVVASEQRAGRGRAGRSWSAAAGSALLCSVLLRPQLAPDDLGMLPLMAGVAVARTVERHGGVATQVKWPNDVLVGGRKIAGVLMQSRIGAGGVAHVVLGIGLNVSASLTELPAGATSLRAASGRSVPLDAVEATLFAGLDEVYRATVAAGGRPDPAEWLARAAFLGERAQVVDGGEALVGEVVGITPRGALRLRTADGRERHIIAGDLTRGPRATAGE